MSDAIAIALLVVIGPPLMFGVLVLAVLVHETDGGDDE